MSLIASDNSRSHNAGYFLESEVGAVRKTKTIKQDTGVAVGDRKIVAAGTAWPKDDTSAEGIVYEDIDVTDGDAAGSVVLKGRVYTERTSVSTSKATLAGKGFTFIDTVPAITRGDED